MGSDLSQPTSTSLFLATSRFVPIAKEFLCTVFVFFDCQHSVYINQTSYYRMPLNVLRVLLYESFFHSGIFELAR
jgi:hypothetical protein